MSHDVSAQSHYTDNGIQPIEVMEKDFTKEQMCGFLKGNVLKYLLRYDKKDGVKDLEKARVYLNWLIESENGWPLTVGAPSSLKINGPPICCPDCHLTYDRDLPGWRCSGCGNAWRMVK